MKLEKVDSRLLKILYLDGALVFLCQLLGWEGLVSGLFALTFPLTVLLWLRSVRRTLTGMDLVVLLTAALAAVSVLLDAAVRDTPLGFDYLKKYVMFVMTLLFFQTVYRFRVGNDVAAWVFRLGDWLTIAFTGAYLLGGSRMYEIGGRVSGYLSFGFTNPNLAALVLCTLYMLQLGRGFASRKGWLGHLAAAVYLGYLMYATRSRNCLLAAAVFTAGVVIRRRGTYPICRHLAALIAVLPGVFVVVYAALVEQSWAAEVFSFLVGEGKGLDSRMDIWAPALEAVKAAPLTGAYSLISGGTGASQMHNSHLDIAASYGVPVLVLVCVLLAKYLRREPGDIWGWAFACAILLGLGEAAVFSGGLGIYLFAGMFRMLANREREIA